MNLRYMPGQSRRHVSFSPVHLSLSLRHDVTKWQSERSPHLDLARNKMLDGLIKSVSGVSRGSENGYIAILSAHVGRKIVISVTNRSSPSDEVARSLAFQQGDSGGLTPGLG